MNEIDTSDLAAALRDGFKYSTGPGYEALLEEALDALDEEGLS